MSLKAKIEAVIYASEEPVTLAQLIGLLGQEGQAELNRADEAQPSLALDEAGTPVESALPDEPSTSSSDDPATLAIEPSSEADAVATGPESIASEISPEEPAADTPPE